MANKSENGSTLLVVLVAIMMMTVMMTGLLGVSSHSLWESGQYVDGTKALANAQSGMQAVYNQMQDRWAALTSGSLGISDAETDLNSFATQINSLPALQNNSRFACSVQQGSNNFNDVNSDPNGIITASNLYQNFAITVTGVSNGIMRTLYDTFQISGDIDAYHYALFTPGDLVISGYPEIDGSVSAMGSVYFDTRPWASDGNFSRVPVGEYEPGEPDVYPVFKPWDAIEPSSTIASGSGFYSFSSFKYGDGIDNIPSNYFWDESKIANTQPISTQSSAPNNIWSYLNGAPSLGVAKSLLPGDYVQQTVEGKKSSMSSAAMENNINLNKSWNHLSGYYNSSLTISSSTTITGSLPLFINGNLTVNNNSNLYFNQPVFVTGNFTYGDNNSSSTFINSNYPIYVEGTTSIINPASQTGQLNVLSEGDMTIQRYTNSPPTSPTTIDAFLVSGGNINLMGMTSYYHIVGGIAGSQIHLNSTVGASQYVTSGGYLASGNSLDHSPRLQITFDPTYANKNMEEASTLSKPILQAMPQPTATKPNTWPE